MSFHKKYLGKGLNIAFPFDNDWYLYDHDGLLEIVLRATQIGKTESWSKMGGYSFPRISNKLHKLLEPYKIPKTRVVAIED